MPYNYTYDSSSSSRKTRPHHRGYLRRNPARQTASDEARRARLLDHACRPASLRAALSAAWPRYRAPAALPYDGASTVVDGDSITICECPDAAAAVWLVALLNAATDLFDAADAQDADAVASALSALLVATDDGFRAGGER